MGTVGALRDRDTRGRFTGRPSPYQGSRPGADVSGPTGLSMQSANAAGPANRKYATGFPTNYNVNYASIVPSARHSKYTYLVNDGAGSGAGSLGLQKDVHHKGFVVFLVRDWSFIENQVKGANLNARNHGHISEIVSLAGLNAILYAQQLRASKQTRRIITPKHVVQAVNFHGIVRNEVGEQLEDVFMNSVESGLAQASVFNVTVRGRVPTQNVWTHKVKGNQMLYLIVVMHQMQDSDGDERKAPYVADTGYRSDPNGVSTGKLPKLDADSTSGCCVQVLPWIAPDGSDRPPNSQELQHPNGYGGMHGYYIPVGRCSDRKKYATANEAASEKGWYDARCAIIAPLVELHVETCNPPVTYGQTVFEDAAQVKDPFFKLALFGEPSATTAASTRGTWSTWEVGDADGKLLRVESVRRDEEEY